MSAVHTPGGYCDECEGHCVSPVGVSVNGAGAEISFRIGQRVRHQDYKGQRVTGLVRQLSIDGERGLMVLIALDAPIVIPANDRFAAIHIRTQEAPAHEFQPVDERDELVAALLAALEEARTGLLWYRDSFPQAVDGSDDEAMARIDAAIAKATMA